MSKAIMEFRRLGFSAEDIEYARLHQEAQKRVGATVGSLNSILTGEKPRPRKQASVVELTPRQLRSRGTYGQAAVLLDVAALGEKDPGRAAQARTASTIAKQLARPGQLEFDFWKGGNMITADQYHDAIRERLTKTNLTAAERAQALAVLQEIKRWLLWQEFTCGKTAAEIGDLLGFNKFDMSRTLATLEQIGAITRVKRGRTKVITVSPEGAFRGKIENHNEVLERYKAEIVPFRPELATSDFVPNGG